jgi:hypothetical protein
VSSWEFTEWIAFWQYEAELANAPAQQDRPMTPEQSRDALRAFAEKHNARWAAQQAREKALAK